MDCLRFFLTLLSFLLIQSSKEDVTVPQNLKSIAKKSISSKLNDNIKPIIANNHVFYLEKGNTKVYDINNGYSSTLNPHLELEAILCTKTNINFHTIFFERECILYITKEKGKNTFDSQFLYDINLKKNFGDCYYSMRIYYDDATNYAAVYNKEASNNIIILDFKKLNDGEKDYKILEIKNSYRIYQSLIYTNPNGDKSALIITDYTGIKFYNLNGYLSGIFSNREGELIDSKDGGNNGLICFIDGDKLLYVYFNTFRVFELDPIKEIYKKDQLLDVGEYIKCLLGLKDGKVLIGTNEGYIYLISYSNNELKIIDNKQICNEPVYSLSYDNNCLEGTLSCYKFAANCNKLLIFQIGIEDEKSNNYQSNSNQNDNNDYGILILIVVAIIICIIIFNYSNYCKNQNNNHSVISHV